MKKTYHYPYKLSYSYLRKGKVEDLGEGFFQQESIYQGKLGTVFIFEHNLIRDNKSVPETMFDTVIGGRMYDMRIDHTGWTDRSLKRLCANFLKRCLKQKA